MIPFATFRRQHRSKSLEEFLGAVTVPHLYLQEAADGDAGGFSTVNLSKPRPSSTGRATLYPVRKRDDSNAFAMMITLGRAPNNDLIIADGRVSKFHAYFREERDGWFVADASSRNGTALNGVELAAQEATRIHSGDRLLLSEELTLVFLDPRDLYRRLES